MLTNYVPEINFNITILYLGVDGRITLRWILGKWGLGMWIGLIWLRIRTGGGLL
jgi:hypothetical protein